MPGFRFLLAYYRNFIVAIWLEIWPKTRGLRTTIYTLTRHMYSVGRRADEGSVASSSCCEEPGVEKAGVEATAAVGPGSKLAHKQQRALLMALSLPHYGEVGE